MKRKCVALILVLALVFLAGCGQKREHPFAEYTPSEAQRLVVYTSHKKEVWWPLIKEFEERTGIWVDVKTGGTNELLEQIKKEADEPKADVMFGGGVESLCAYQEYFLPYTSAEADQIVPRFRDGENRWTPFSSLPVVLVYNPKLVAPDMVTGWKDLFNPAFRGKIAFADPAVSGSSFTGLVTLATALDMPFDDVICDFCKNLDGLQLGSSGAVLDAVCSGSAWVGVTLEETAQKRIAAGENLAMVYPCEGTSCVPDASALIKGAPHTENAKLFLDFTVSKEVQTVLAEQFYRRAVRKEISAAEDLIPFAEILLVEYNIGEVSKNREPILMAWAFYFDLEETE